MKLSEMVDAFTSSPRLKAKLKKRIKLKNGHIFKKGTVSELLIPSGSGNIYHFEAEGEACIVSKEELDFL